MKTIQSILFIPLFFLSIFVFTSCGEDNENENNTINNISSSFKWGDSKAIVLRDLTDYKTEIENNTIFATRIDNDIRTAYQFDNDSLCAIVILASVDQISETEIERYNKGYEFIGSLSENKKVYIDTRNNKILQIQKLEIDETEYHSIGWAPIE